MDIIETNFEQLKKYNFKETVLTIGSFDGVHLAHKHIFKKMSSFSQNHKKIVITFDPHPLFVVNPKISDKNYLLTTMSEKFNLIKESNIDFLIVLKFDRKTSEISAENFLEKLLETFNPSYFVMGYNHHFGYNKKGNFDFVKKFVNENVKVIKVDKKNISSHSVSSTIIRDKIKNGNMKLASELLGRDYNIEGIIIKGNGIGRKISFPTINMFIKNEHKLKPPRGVYCVKVNLDNKSFKGMCNIGFRPTLTNDKEESIEVHIFNDDIIDNYHNKVMNIEFISYIREEKKFKNLDLLKEQLQKDKQHCLSIL